MPNENPEQKIFADKTPPSDDHSHEVIESEAEEFEAEETEEFLQDPQLQYRLQLKQAVTSARKVIDGIQAGNLTKELSNKKEEPKSESKPLPNLEELETSRRKEKKTLTGTVKEKFRFFSLAREGVKNPEAVAVLIDHLEFNFTETEYGRRVIPKEAVETERKKLIADGCSVGSAYPSYPDRSKVELKFSRNVPYTVKKKEAAELEKLLGAENDPLATIELLKRLGFSIDGHTFRHRMTELQEFVSKPGMNEALTTLSALGLKLRSRYFGREKDAGKRVGHEGVTDIETIIDDKELMSKLTSGVGVAINTFVRKYELEAELEPRTIKLLVDTVTTPRAEEFIEQIMSDADGHIRYLHNILPFVQAVKNTGFLDKAINLGKTVKLGELTAVQDAQTYRSKDATWDANAAAGAFQLELESGEMLSLTEHPEQFKFVHDVAVLIGRPLGKKERETLLRHENKRDEILVIFTLAHQLGVEFPSYSFEERLEEVAQSGGYGEHMKLILDGDFVSFLTQLKERTGLQYSMHDLLPRYRTIKDLVDLSHDQEKRTFVLSPICSEIAKSLGGFDLGHIDNYFQLSKHPETLPLIAKTKEMYGYAPGENHQWGEVEGFKTLLTMEGAERRLVTETAQKLYRQLHSEFDWSFKPDQAKDFIELAENMALQEKIFEPANLEFIKRTSRDYSIKALELYTALPENIRSVVIKLKNSFDYNLRTAWGERSIDDLPTLEYFASNPDVCDTLFDDKTVRLVSGLKDAGLHLTVNEYPELLKAELDEAFPGFLKQFQIKTGLSNFRLHNIPILKKFMERGDDFANVIKALREFYYPFELSDYEYLKGFLIYSPEQIREKLNLARGVIPDFRFRTEYAEALFFAITQNYTETDFEMFAALQNKYSAGQSLNFQLIKNYAELREHEPVINTARETLKNEFGFGLDQIVDTHQLRLFGQENIAELMRLYHSDRPMQFVIMENIDRIAEIAPEKRVEFVRIIQEIKNSPSQEIKRLERELIGEVLHTPNPLAAYKKIEDIFIKNNLPPVGKAFKVFETLYPSKRLEASLGDKTSPVLNRLSSRGRYFTIYGDLLRTHVRSGNRTLRDYVEVFEDGEALINKIDQGGVAALSQDEQEQLAYTLGKLDTLFLNSMLGKKSGTGEITTSNLEEKLVALRQNLKVKEGQRLTDRIAEMYARPAGYQSFAELLADMRAAKIGAHERGLERAKAARAGLLTLQEGDLLKGVNATYIENILQNGSVAKEYLGAWSSRDATPLDTDVSRVTKEDAAGTFESAVRQSLATGYGSLLFAVKNRGQFVVTGETGEKNTEGVDKKKLELFETGGGRHFGIRTGFPTTEIDFMIAQDNLLDASEKAELESIFFEIAQNGFYIPIVNTRGELIYTPELYDEYRGYFRGLDRFDGETLDVARLEETYPLRAAVEALKTERIAEGQTLTDLLEMIRRNVKNTLKTEGIKLRSPYDRGILGADLVETGSIGRRTNLPGDYDFDLALKLDAKDFPKAEEIARKLRGVMKMTGDNSHMESGGYYQLRAVGVTEIGGVSLPAPVNIDIGLASRSERIAFDTQEALEERFEWVNEHKGEEMLEELRANIVLAKKVLKAAEAYKKFEHGGLGGVGVENWIISNKGNIIEAFKSFTEAAHEDEELIPLGQFKRKYKVVDPGWNIKKQRHDNFVHNLTEDGYARMVEVIDTYLGIERKVVEKSPSA